MSCDFDKTPLAPMKPAAIIPLLLITLAVISPLATAVVETTFRSHSSQQSKLGLHDVGAYIRSDILGVARKAVGNNYETYFQEETASFHTKAKVRKKRQPSPPQPPTRFSFFSSKI